jgi:hypothetical protein
VSAEVRSWRAEAGGKNATPPRARNSARRTVTIDVIPEDAGKALVLRGRGRDLATRTWSSEVLDEAFTTVVIDPVTRVVQHVELEPALFDARDLAGRPAGSGFRRALTAASANVGLGALVVALLDEVPVATLISGAIWRSAGSSGPMSEGAIERRLNVCSGWIETGTLAAHLRQTGAPPQSAGPVVDPLERFDDPAGWHTLDRLPLYTIRRARRMDVSLSDGAAAYAVEAFLRDSRVMPPGGETAVHEYRLQVQLDNDRIIRRVLCEPGVLPASECRAAVSSAERLIGLSLPAVEQAVRSSFSGVLTCTHLNDTMRALSGVSHLVDALARDY